MLSIQGEPNILNFCLAGQEDMNHLENRDQTQLRDIH